MVPEAYGKKIGQRKKMKRYYEFLKKTQVHTKASRSKQLSMPQNTRELKKLYNMNIEIHIQKKENYR